MNTPSKEALDASESVQDYLGFPRRATMDLAAIIDRHFEPLRQRAEQAEARVKELAGALREVLDAPDSTVSEHLYNRMEQVLASHAAGEPAKRPDTERLDWLEIDPQARLAEIRRLIFTDRDTVREAIDAARKEAQT